MSQISGENFTEDAREFEGKKYALVVGVNQSTNMPKFPPSLRYAESDAAGISYLLGREACNFAFPSGYLIGAAASTRNVRKAMSYLIDDKSENDLLLFYFIGHGYAKIGSEILLVTSDFDPEDARLSPDAYISLSEIRETLYERQTTASVICILDCLYTGDIEKSPPPEKQFAQSLKAFARDIAHIEQAPVSSRRTWVILASTEPEGERKGHALMTGLITEMLNGEIEDALDHKGNLTLLTLYNYLQKKLKSGQQGPIMDGRFGSFPWVLAHHPLEDRVRREPEERPKPSQSSLSSLHLSFDMSPSPAVFADLDPQQVREFLKKERVQLQRNYRADLSEQDQMQALGLMCGEHPSYGASLCFGRNPSHQVVGAYTRCVYWSDTKRLSGWIDDRECRGSLVQQFTQACDFLRNHLHFSRVIDRGGSSERPEIPFRALEEAVANALIHREYVTERDRMTRTESIQVEIFSDRVEVTSPGGLAAPLDLKHPESHPRNSQIMRIFYLAGLVEMLGTGLIRIQKWMQESGLPQELEDIIRTDQQAFTIILRRRVQSLALLTAGAHILTSQRTSQTQVPTSSLHINSLSKSSPLQKAADALAFHILKRASQTQVPLSEGFEGSGAPISQSVHDSSSPDKNKKPLALSPDALHKPHKPLLALLIVVTILASVVGLYFVNGQLSYFAIPTPPLGPASTTIEIASNFPTSGVDTTSGLPLQNGVQMAIAEANNEHLLPGYTLKLVPYDDVGRDNRHDPQVGTKNLKHAIADNLVAGVIGPYNSSVALDELPLANRAPLALLSPSATFPCLTKSATEDSDCTGANDIATQMRPTTNQLTFFRLASTDDQQGKAAADYFAQHHYSKVLLLKDDSDPYSFGLAQAFQTEWKNVGGRVLPVDFPQSASSVQDYQSTLQEVASTQPDLIYFAGNDPNGSYVLQALSNVATLKTVPFAGGDSIMDSSLLQTAANLHWVTPIYVSLPMEDPAHSGTPIGADFATYYTANGYEYYRPYAAAAYDCTMILIKAIKATSQKGVSTPHGTQDNAGAVRFRQAVLEALRDLPPYTGATGTHSFDSNGDTTNHTISFYQANLSAPPPSWMWLQQVKG